MSQPINARFKTKSKGRSKSNIGSWHNQDAELDAISDSDLALESFHNKPSQHQPRARKKMTPLNYGFYLLSRRDYSLAEIETKFKHHYAGHIDELSEIDTVIDRLLELNYLDDERFAEGFTRKELNRGQGPSKVRWALRQKGISHQLIEQVVEPIDWFKVCQDVLLARIHRLDPNDTNKIYRFLAGRGFSSEHIQDSLSVLKQNASHDK